MFDLKTFNVLGRIPADEDVDAVVYDAPSHRVFTFNGDARSTTVIDPLAGTRLSNIPLGGKPEYAASRRRDAVREPHRHERGRRNRRQEYDGDAALVDIACTRPVTMAIDPAHRRLFSGCRSGVMAVSDDQAGKAVATLPIGAGVDGAG
jgi:hypothetical protein